MAGTVEGGKKAAKKNLEKDPNFYARIGAKGGKKGRTGGFYRDSERARIAGAKGGRISRKGKANGNSSTESDTVSMREVQVSV